MADGMEQFLKFVVSGKIFDVCRQIGGGAGKKPVNL